VKKRVTKTPETAREMTAAESLRTCGIGPDVQPPVMTVEWQVTPAGGTTHVFTSPGKVFSFLASEWARFVTSWDPAQTTRLSVEVRRVEREKHEDESKPLSPTRQPKE
jgi:hypothetical protein